jgi:hypothetical protein
MYSVRQNSNGETRINDAYRNMAADEGQNFLEYLIRLGLIGESNLLVLSDRDHYYFDQNDLRSIRVLVNLKKLNLIKHLVSFLHVIFRVLPPKASFIGCFTDIEYQGDNGFNVYQASYDFNKFINPLDSKANLHLDKNNVSRIFESHGFKIVDMTQIKEQVYFTCQNKKCQSD